ncbi:H-NS histone family protein [Burkholderia vietnamiensis]|jgi:DNA-binding protein H-NS|uniref:H-NS histone n=1 Tax=Burkholderia aenigmatica TaxID=2015348 RepID=A0A6P2SVX7_9BURK|nr:MULTISPECIES: H-NS histone family protein [Burkholderia cepacia complex]HDR9763294.1 H-NS histone family protein [Burkholderia cepacia ATCC 25416]MBR7917334.1 H-NS histone family protein [Burkholderia vietnamiensis]MBR8055239.1 H-NS histone family protein [Burkholderia vietnamiensis]VWC53582.1 H-NS histone [Burkholderia aenigmatica]HDR9795570.1 H-NS histone family protein [Burkholderia cepacia ATCC 25416]
MANRYKDLLAQHAALEKQIEEARNKERGDAINTIRQLMQDYEITTADLTVKKRKARSPVTQKYKDPNSDKTWSGMGKPPAWIAGKDRQAFLIA